MMNDITIRKLTIADLDQYREIRLTALKNEPTYFGSSYEEEAEFELYMWTNRLTKEHINAFGAFDQDKLVGITLGVLNPRKKLSHVAHINSVYVLDAYRKKGIAKRLLVEVMEYLKKSGIEIILLSVQNTNKNAIAMYEKIGFKIYGEEKNTIKYNGEYYSQYLMEYEVKL